MVGLPRGLASWADELHAFPPDVTLTLEPWLLRLDAAVGRLRAHAPAGDGPPDGFAGLSRRGRYDRLLVSEWLLAEAAPDEFTRRAASAEHLFYALARRDRAADTRSAVLFDAGPDQLGAPRLAHLALLVVLARRARQAGARFVWGVLQADPARPQPGLTEEAVRSLLDRRSPRAAREADLERWRDALGGALEGDDLWLVGGPGLRDLWPGRGRRATVQDPRTLGPRTLTVELARRTLRLDLPPEPIGVRMLRNPYEAPPPPGVVPDALPHGDALRFSDDGRRLFVRTATGVTMHPLPHGRGERGHPRQLSGFGGEVRAIGTAGRSFCLLVEQAGTLALHTYSRRGRLQSVFPAKPADDTVRWASRPGALAGLHALGSAHDAPWGAIDGRHRLLCFGMWADAPATVGLHGVAALGRLDGRVWLLYDRALVPSSVVDGGATLGLATGPHPVRLSDLPARALVRLGRRGEVEDVQPQPPGDGHAGILQERRMHGSRIGLFAAQRSATRWTVSTLAGLWRLAPADVEVPAGQVVGVIAEPGKRGVRRIGLVTLDEDGQQVRGAYAAAEEVLHVLRYPARHWAWSPTEPRLAYLDDDDALHVEDVRTGHEVLRLASPAPSQDPDAG